MMPESRVHPGRPGAARAGGSYTRPRPAVHTPRTVVHPVHTTVPGVPGSAAPGVYTRPGSGPAVHTAPEGAHTAPAPDAASVHTPAVAVHTLVWATRHLVHTSGRALVSGGVYTGPASVVPPVVAAVTWGDPAAGRIRRPRDLRVRQGVVA